MTSCALILSGGVDTCARLEATSEIGMRFDTYHGCDVIGDKSPGENFASFAVKQQGYSHAHHVVRMTSQDLVKNVPTTNRPFIADMGWNDDS